jgi:magnesium-transporting ATPase (P-type)
MEWRTATDQRSGGGRAPASPAGASRPDPSTLDVEEVVRDLDTDPDQGLTAAEAARRLAEDGPNDLVSAPPVPAWRRVLLQFEDPLIYLLLAAVVVSIGAWLTEGAEGWPVDAVVILVIVVANAVLGFVQEARAADAVAALAQMAAPTSSVLRDGHEERIATTDLVRGDVLVLAEGDSIGADARLVRAVNLRVAEASLTGESEAVTKDAATLAAPAALGDRVDMVFKGTAVVQGVGRAVATSTGMGTEVGRIAELLTATEEKPTPLTIEVQRLGKTLGIAVIAIAVVVVATIFATSDIRTSADVVTVLLLGVSLAVAAVPEGLPAILSVVLAIGVQRMARRNAIVKELASVETLGAASVICSDKTGTLTKNEMTIERVVTATGRIDLTGVGYRPDGRATSDGRPVADLALLAEARLVLAGGELASNASLREVEDEWHIQGDPTEAAFLVAVRKLDGAEEHVGQYERIGEIPFTSERKLMSTLVRDRRDGRLLLVTKGAPDVLIHRCSRLRVGDDIVPFDDDQRGRALADVEALSAQAFRTLGVAYRDIDAREPWEADPEERDLVYVGVAGIIDPPRDEAAAAVLEAHTAGIRVLMITGDHPLTGARIATDLGIAAPGAAAITGLQLDALDDVALREVVATSSVFARVAPEHKLRIIAALQSGGHVVAMTGDGVNDAPALKAADIGVAMGITGTEVSKEAANMILADDDFTTIVAAVREGRGIFDNIKKFLRYLLSSNMGEVLTVFFGVLLSGTIGLTAEGDGLALPLLATQILWINLITDAAPALAMGVDPETDDVMVRAPRKPTERVIDARMWVGVGLIGLVMAAATLVTIDLHLPGGMVEGHQSLEVARTAGFTTLVLAQLFNCLSARSETSSAFRHLFVNRWLWGAIALAVLLQLAVVHLPVLNHAFETVPLSVGQWATSAALASSVLWAAEVRKVIWRAVGPDARRARAQGTTVTGA